MPKNFRLEFFKFYNMLKEGEPYAISRVGDGELALINNDPINLLNKGNGEFKNEPNNPAYDTSRKLMKASFAYKHDNYYVGLPCPCCIGQAKYESIKTQCPQDEAHMTWANVFVNSNYPLFQEHFIPELSNKRIVLVSHTRSKIDDLPFKDSIEHWHQVGPNAWLDDLDLVSVCQQAYSHCEDIVFLLCAGPFSNILAHQLFAWNPNNIYIDVGSTLDPYLGLGKTRGYLKGSATLTKTCRW